MMRSMIGAAIMLLLLAACGTPPLSDRVNGTWTNALFTATIDTQHGTYDVTALGQHVHRALAVTGQQGAVLSFRLDNGELVTAQMQPDGSLILTEAGGPPYQLMRVAPHQ